MKITIHKNPIEFIPGRYYIAVDSTHEPVIVHLNHNGNDILFIGHPTITWTGIDYFNTHYTLIKEIKELIVK